MTSRTSAHARAFTLTEMLLVIGIIMTLLAIILPATMRAMRAADRARTLADLQTIAVGLDEYYKDFQEYPRSSNIASSTAPAPYRGSHVLVEALLAPRNDDGNTGFGFRPRGTQGKIYGPYIKSENFKYQYGPGTDNTYGTSDDLVGELYDRSGVAIRYVPANATPGKININAGGNYIRNSGTALYDYRYVTSGTPASAEVRYFCYTMGDKDDTTPTPNAPTPDYMINPNETPLTQGPYILWAAGPDGSFGPSTFTPNEAARCDDVFYVK